jgi:AcrR family transcriptional regulator
MADGARADKRYLTRSAIEAAALQLFSERGYDGTDVAAIAERAGVSRRTFFRHFRQKSEVIFGPEGSYEASLRALVAGQPSRDTPSRVVSSAILAFAGSVESDRELMLVRSRLVAATTELLQYALLLQRGWTDAIAEELGRRAGRTSPSLEDRMLASWGIAAYAAAVAEWLAHETSSLRALTEAALSVRIRSPREAVEAGQPLADVVAPPAATT